MKLLIQGMGIGILGISEVDYRDLVYEKHEEKGNFRNFEGFREWFLFLHLLRMRGG